MSATEPGVGADEPTPRDAAAGRDAPDTIDFFGASPSPTLPVPTTPPPAAGPAPSDPSAPGGPGAAAPDASTSSDAPDAPDAPAGPRRGVRVRVRTLVFGLVMLVVSGACLVSLLTRIRVDAGVVALAVLIGAGAALLVGGLSAAITDVRRGGTRYT